MRFNATGREKHSVCALEYNIYYPLSVINLIVVIVHLFLDSSEVQAWSGETIQCETHNKQMNAQTRYVSISKNEGVPIY